jgi:hypothetical protein
MTESSKIDLAPARFAIKGLFDSAPFCGGNDQGTELFLFFSLTVRFVTAHFLHRPAKFRVSPPERFALAGVQQSGRRILTGAVQKQEITRVGGQLIGSPEGGFAAAAVAMFSESPEVVYAEPNLRYQFIRPVGTGGGAVSSPRAVSRQLRTCCRVKTIRRRKIIFRHGSPLNSQPDSSRGPTGSELLQLFRLPTF